MKNITYLLGAGASYHSIPIVDGMGKRMKMFVEMFDDYTDSFIIERPETMQASYDNHFYADLDMKQLMSKFKNVVQQALLHKTVDTYAKKLFLKNDVDKLNELKTFLCCYFAFEQCRSQRKIATGKHFLKTDSTINIEHILNDLDYRYDVFLASLLTTNLELPENVNIVSWNYDHQLEQAYIDYSDSNFLDAKTQLKIYPFVSISESRIIKLNGSADFYYNSEREIGITFTDGNHHQQYQDTLKFVGNIGFDNINNHNLQFAWESGNEESLIKAMEILSQTDELIIIGYSFPYFNRDVDIRLLKELKTINVKVQCSPEHFSGIHQSLIDIIGENVHDQIKYHDDLKQFYIPTTQFRK